MKCEESVQIRMVRDLHVGALAAGKNPKTHRFTKIMPHLPCLTMPSPPTHGQIDDCRLSQRSRIFRAARQIRCGVSSHYSRDKSGVIPTIPSLHPVVQEMGYHTLNTFFISPSWYICVPAGGTHLCREFNEGSSSTTTSRTGVVLAVPVVLLVLLFLVGSGS